MVMIQRMLCSLNDIVRPKKSMNETQSNVLIRIPENIVDNDQVAALSDNASVLFSGVVFLIINGREHTLMSIMPMPQDKNDN
jgi:hypothetical protein